MPKPVENTIYVLSRSCISKRVYISADKSWNIAQRIPATDTIIWETSEDPNSFLLEIGDTSLDSEHLTPAVRVLMDIIYNSVVGMGGLPVHGGLLEKHGEGMILAASGGTGKSTCCARVPDPWIALGDDHSLITYHKVFGYQAHPFPTWNDLIIRHQRGRWNCSHSVKLRGIFFLEQSSSDSVKQMGGGEATIRLIESATQAMDTLRLRPHRVLQELRKILFSNATDLTRVVPAYRLFVSLQGSFWEKIEETLAL